MVRVGRGSWIRVLDVKVEIGIWVRVGVGLKNGRRKQMEHTFTSSNSDEFTENARLVLFQFNVATESRDVYERVGGSEGLPSSISVVFVFVFIFMAVPTHLGLIRHLKRILHIHPSPRQLFHRFRISSFLRLLFFLLCLRNE
jgi:hypothetical protein